MYKFFISILLIIISVDGFSQEQEKSDVKKDSVTYKTGYGLRLGLDISKPIKSILDDSYSGFEITGDYRITKNWYAAAELGYEEENTIEDFTNSTAKGSYIRLGANYNAYENWLDMNNEIFVGFRYGFSIFDNTVNSYTPNTGNTYFTANQIDTPFTDTGLTAHWAELQLGLKAETLKNLFIGFSFSYKVGISIDNPENFKTLFAPGFNRVYANNVGFGFNYTISYLIPFVNK